MVHNPAQEFHSFLMALNANPEKTNNQLRHFLDHLFSILKEEEAEAVKHYYGILGHEQMVLNDIARERQVSEAEILQEINNNVRRIAITPEWQQLRNITLAKAYSRKTNNRTDYNETVRNDYQLSKD